MLAVFILMIISIVIISEAQRSIPVQYAKRIIGRKVYGGQSTYIPLRINQGGVIPIIFASSVLLFPATIAQFVPLPFMHWIAGQLSPSKGLYMALYFLLIFFFTYFYTAITFNPKDLAENIKKYGGFIMGIRPGAPTAAYLESVVTKLTFVGALFLAVIAVIPTIVEGVTHITSFQGLGSTALLIVVGVALDLVRQIETHLVTRQYEGLVNLSMAKVYVLAGPPGSGKGTQAKLLAPKLKVPHISLGDLLREAVRSGTEVGKLAKSYLDAGKLVPDSVAIKVAEEAVTKKECKNGFVIDGFPRTLEQAKLFDALLSKLKFDLSKVLYIDIPLKEILKRLTGRRSCRNCGAVYHLMFKPPKVENVCDICGGELYQRKDDTEDVIKVRYGVYEKQTEPLVDYYKKQGKLAHIDGTQKVEQVFKEVCKAVS